MIKTRVWAVSFAAAALVLAAAAFALPRLRTGGAVAVVTQDGAVLREIDLSRVTEAYTFTVTAADGGTNVIEVEPGRIRVAEADCPDRICVMQGWLPDGALPIACLPHGLLIEMRDAGGASGADALAR